MRFLTFILLLASLSSFAGTLAQFRTPLGTIDVELYDKDKPVTVQNFIQYVQSGAYTNMFFHRWVPGFIIQGGGFAVTNRGSTNVAFANVPNYGSITNEFNVGPIYSNVFGTIAMAKLPGDPNSASSQWFFNLANNSTNLDNQNGGFTVFGHVVRGTNILNRLKPPPPTNGIYIVNAGGALNELPVLATNADYDDLVYADVTVRNLQLVGKTLVMKATNSSGEGFTNGSFLLVLAGGTNDTFRLVPISNGTAAASGLYTYTYLGATSGIVSLRSNFDTTLTFTSPTTGSFLSTNNTGDSQSGTFILAKSSPDFNGDGLGDILLQRTNGLLAAWLMNGTQLVRGTSFPTTVAGPSWRCFGSADFNSDGQSDIVCQQNSTGKLAVWFKNGTNFSSALLRSPGISWRAVSAADFNEDAKPDLLFQHVTDRRSVVWLMDGTNFNGGVVLRSGSTPPAIGWGIIGTGDFNGDGHTDVVWRHSDGRMAVWHLVRTTYSNAAMLRNSPADSTGWRINGVADFNLDGKTDLLLQNVNGQTAFWFFTNTTFQTGKLFRNIPAGWQIVAPK